MLRASDNAGTILWPAVKGIMIEAGASRRTVQYNLRRLVQMEVLAIEVHENQWVNKDYFRRTRTYKINLVRLKSFPRPKEVNSSEWRTYREYKSVTKRKTRQAQAHRSPHPAAHASPRPAPQKPAHVHTLPATIPPSEQVKQSPVRGITRSEQRLHDKRIALTRRIGELVKGCNQRRAPEGFGIELYPGDEGYRAPMPLQKALPLAARELGITTEEAERELKLLGWKPETED